MHCILPYVHNKVNAERTLRKPVIAVTGGGRLWMRTGRWGEKGGKRLFTISFFIFLNPVSILAIQNFKLELFFIKNVYNTSKQLTIIQ